MQPNELRIGNYVKAKKTTTIDENTIELDSWKFQDLLMSDIIKYLEPIPLTEDWHKKFGVKINGFFCFEYNLCSRQKIVFTSDYVFLRDITSFKGQESNEDNICTLWNKDNKKRDLYVHEWQNLYFALTNKELILNTDKQ